MRLKISEEELVNEGFVIGKTISENIIVWEKGFERLVYDLVEQEVIDAYFERSTFISYN